MATAKTKVVEEKEVETNDVNEVKAENSIDLEALMALVKSQAETIEQLKTQMSTPQQPQVVAISREALDMVTVVHLKDYPTRIKMSSGRMLALNTLKQVSDVTRSEAEGLINNYPKAFENGWITFTGDYGRELLSINQINIDQEKINKIFNYKDCIKLTNYEIVKYYEDLLPVQQDMFVSWWYNEAASDDERFLNIEVVNNLNKASDGKFAKLLKDKIVKG